MMRVQVETSVVAPEISLTSSLTFDEFYARSYDSIARALSLTLGDPNWGAEATDEAMTRAYSRWKDVSTYDNPEGWTYRVGLNWAYSWQRKLARKLPWTPETSTLPVTNDPELDAALQTLDPKYRSVVVCRYFLDWSTEQTATALDIAPGTVKSRLSTGLTQLRRKLDPTNPREVKR